jgi:predicted O-methyltransferase YrrM
MTDAAQERPIFFGIDLPRADAVHPRGVPLLLRGVLAFATGPAARVHVRVGGRPLVSSPLGDTRDDVRDLYPPARLHDRPCGYHLYCHLPDDLNDGVHQLDFLAEDTGGTIVPVGSRAIRLSSTDGEVFNPFPDGHFYSAVVNVAELARERARVWPDEPTIVGIDFRHESQRRILVEEFPKYAGDFDYPFDLPPGSPEYAYRRNNPVFSMFDATTLFVLLRSIRPTHMIEVGSGYSSLLVADVNRRFLGSSLDFTCIEPYPRPFLKEGIPGMTRLITKRVQEAPLGEYQRLGAGDILFIDSSHVGKTGSDVNHLFFEVIPRLRAGVVIHVHDIFLPHDYPVERVLGEKLSWNEQYLLRALLMFSDTFEVVFGASYARHYFPELLDEAARATLSGSFWFRKVK